MNKNKNDANPQHDQNFEKKKGSFINPYFVLKHEIADYIGCDLTDAQLNSGDFFRPLCKKAVELANSRIVKTCEYNFQPQGYTLMMVLADSSLVLHSWPEEKFITVEIFTCTEKANPIVGLDYLKDVFKPKKY
ncbi:MAG: adenosylmethionine decarboxylase, partial [Promethearchaeota archaeon]